jgi:multidrug efflux pump
MICAHFVRAPTSPDATRFDRVVEAILGWMVRSYMRTLAVAMRHRFVMGVVMIATVVVTIALYVKTPKGYFPQDDTGLVIASTSAATDVSYEQMAQLQQRALDIVLADPAVYAVGSSVGATGFNASANQGRMFISLKPLADRGGMTTLQVIDRLRRALIRVQGISVFMTASQDIRVGGRQGRAAYQYSFWSPELEDLNTWLPRITERLGKLPELVDVNTDREQGGLQTDIKIDRVAAARLGIKVSDIDNALNNAFAQRQVSMIYTARNQYRVILEVDPRYQRDPSDLGRIFVPSASGAQIPITSVIAVGKSLAPLVVNHQGPFPAATVSYNLAPGTSLDQANTAIQQAVAELKLPDTIRAEPAGDARAAAIQAGSQSLLIIAALIAVYIVLGVLYESLAHPLTIISTLPSAGLGAVIALQLAGMELSVIAFIGIILLIGIVKKNGIMLVDFALEAERHHRLSAQEAVMEAARERFRPILMTTLAALLGAVPLALATGPGSELRRPLGIAIIGGLLVSQVLTLYTTPMIYLLLDKLHRRLGGANQHSLRDADTASQHAATAR